jgi:hypothetical protein
MKKYLLVLILSLASLSASAQWHHQGHWQRGYNGGWNWIVPAIIGGAVVYTATRPETVVVQQPPVVIQPTQTPQTCSPWTETQNPDGTITRTRTCTQ